MKASRKISEETTIEILEKIYSYGYSCELDNGNTVTIQYEGRE